MQKILLPSIISFLLLVLLLGAGCGADEPLAGSCSQNNCTGCCSGVMCKKGTENDACGQHGELCAPCPSGESCQDGVCQPGTCRSAL